MSSSGSDDQQADQRDLARDLVDAHEHGAEIVVDGGAAR